MRSLIFLTLVVSLLVACDENRVYEKNIDFTDRKWPVGEQPSFDFEITDATRPYNLFVNVRNEEAYPNANLYFTWYLLDSTEKTLEKKLVSQFLFEQKTGKPLGKTVLGDIYAHRFPLAQNYQFKSPGTYRLQFEQFMRKDTLPGLLSIGLRVEASN